MSSMEDAKLLGKVVEFKGISTDIDEMKKKVQEYDFNQLSLQEQQKIERRQMMKEQKEAKAKGEAMKQQNNKETNVKDAAAEIERIEEEKINKFIKYKKN